MKKQDAKPFTDFLTDEAMKYQREISAHEIATWFENFTRSSLDEFKRAWEMHKASDRGHFFPRIVDLQRTLKLVHDASLHDRRCNVLDRSNSDRCSFPGTISVDKNKPICRCHFRLFGRTHSPEDSDAIVQASKTRTVDEVFIEMGGAKPPIATARVPEVDMQRAIEDAVATDEAQRDDVMAAAAAYAANATA